MKRILIEHFQSLDNYGTGMMGLVTVQALADRYYEQAMQQIKGLHADTQELLSFLKELKDRRH